MRDDEFVSVFKREELKLDQFFRKKMRENNYKGDRATTSKDLKSLTLLYALENFRKGIFDGYTDQVEKLIWTKADNIWDDFINPPKKALKIMQLEAALSKPDTRSDNFTTLYYKQLLHNLSKMSDPKVWEILNRINEGYEYTEIAEMMNDKPTNLRMLISRYRAKIRALQKGKPSKNDQS